MMARFFLILGAVFFCFTLSPAYAQDEQQSAPASSSPQKGDEFSKATDEQVAEAQKFYHECKGNEFMSQDHDCRCLAGEYLNQRISLGDDVDASVIMDKIRPLCLKDPNMEVGTGKDNLSEYSDEELKDAQRIYNMCKTNVKMQTFYDCRCLSAKYIDKRHTDGAFASDDEVLLAFKDDCKNVPEIAGYKFNTCMGADYLFVPKGARAKDFCECYGNAAATLYANHRGRVSEAAKLNLDGAALAECKMKFRSKQ
ncbi:MAG: hypothetical protein KDI13_08920 [Alphaproteobacteria bacterium]|nr:hypothetical protein [Alphaproteobacteria bacterium]